MQIFPKMQVIAYKYKVYSQNRNHQKRLEELLRTAAWIYNHCIALHKRYYKLYKKTLPKAKLQSHIAKMKKRCYKLWEIVNSMAAQEITDRIYAGYNRFFAKDAKHPPTFKNWRKYKSMTFKSSGWTLNGNVLTINKLKLRLKFHLSRPIDGKIQTVCVKRDAVGDWWLSFCIRKEDNPKQTCRYERIYSLYFLSIHHRFIIFANQVNVKLLIPFVAYEK